MSHQKIIKELKKNINKFSDDELFNFFNTYKSSIIKEYKENERIKLNDEINNRVKSGNAPRPILVVYLDISNTSPAEASKYISDTVKSLEFTVPVYEYNVLVVPRVSGEPTTLEVLNPLNLSQENQEVFIEKINALKGILKKFFETQQ